MNKINLVFLALLTACSTPHSEHETPRAPAGVSANASYYANAISSLDQFKSFAIAGDGIVRGGFATKFLVDWRNRQEPQIYFLNSAFKVNGETPEYVKLHYNFAVKTLHYQGDGDTFNRNYFEPDFNKREFSPGTLQLYTLKSAKGESQNLLGIQFYPGDTIHDDGILKTALLVQSRLNIGNIPLAVVSYGNQQTLGKIAKDLEQHGIQAMSVEAILGSLNYIPMNLGEAWGYIKYFPGAEEDLSPQDIPVFKNLPLELSVVAGVVTVALQDPGSHINLKSKERGTPNMVTRDSKFMAQLKALDGQPAHLVVSSGEPFVEGISKEKLEQMAGSQGAKNWQKIEQPLEANVTSFDEMCPSQPRECLTANRKFGGKASKLGLLASPQVAGIGSQPRKALGYRLTSYGFGVPLTFYREFLEANPELEKQIEALVTAEKSKNPPTPQVRAKMSEDVRNGFYKAVLPKKLLDAVQAELDHLVKQVEHDEPQVKLTKIKVRSSANVEDMKGFNGAGLHDSFGAKLKEPSTPDQVCKKVSAKDPADDTADAVETKEDMEPASLACAIKGVYASLWNKRAIEERNYRKFDHGSAVMGLAVVPSYNFLSKLRDKNAPANGMQETSNSVIVTRVLNTTGVYGYTLSTQEAPNLVTNPTPRTQAEVVVASFLPGEPLNFTVTQMAQPKPGAPQRTTTILTEAQLRQVVNVVQAVEKAYCKINPDYYPAGDCDFATADPEKPHALDMEFKYLGRGTDMRILLKQMREYGGN